ncbi:hypothetical protein [Polaromonas sp. YR568]|uniref:hypothetical protein n=1 Tax=Polaromonas sp. YR568 TaxID=1855301 RepID=UPI0020C83CBA|nr:hypothetical protein [Polaromonas sp. YR568]
MVKRSWSAMGGCLVFDFTINREPADDIPSIASISCKSGPAESQVVTITRLWPSKPFEFKFRSGCYVSGYLQQKTPVHINGVTNTAIFADIHYGMRGQSDDHHFEGIMVACPTRGPVPPPGPPWPPGPPPIEPDPPIDPVEPLPIITSHPDELFPYVYVRRWPKVSAADLLYGFVQYVSASPPSSGFFDDLVSARNQASGAREAAQDLALRFIDGDIYSGDFIRDMDSLAGPVSQFPRAFMRLPRQDASPSAWLAKATEQVTQLLSRYALDWSYFSSAAYAQAVDRVWQSYFALIITLGYDTALLDEFTRALLMAHVVEVALVPYASTGASTGASTSTGTSAGAGEAPAMPEQAHLTKQQINELLQATPALSAQVFPLPPAQAAGASPPSGSPGWIEPYAIGDLQMVRQRLLRYQCGEIARIENVMRGERREVTNKRTHRQLDEVHQSSGEKQLLQNDAADERSNLQEESRKTVAEVVETNQYNKFTNSYGPPTQATLDGSWSKTVQPGAAPGVDDTTRFARDILNKTVNRINRSVSLSRSSSTMSQTEDSVVSLVDNTGGSRNMRGVYRWLNKVYEACVVNYGQRLMMEFMVYKPAASFIAGEQAMAGQNFVKPLSPLQLNIPTFKAITRDNYASLGAYYGVLDLEPPPLEQRFASATLRDGEEKQIAIPAGYCAYKAFVGYISAPVGLPAPVVLVGWQTFTPPGSPDGMALAGEDDSVPVSVLDYPPSLSPPGDPQVQVNIEITCKPSARCMDEWCIRIYASIMRAYQAQLAAYYARADGGPQGRLPTRSPLANRQIEQRELKNACMRLLLERLFTLTGMPPDAPMFSPPSEFAVNEPRYLQFFDEVLEWNEMVYSFYASPGPDAAGAEVELGSLAADDDALFSSFLQADQARVLLPVRPAHVMAFLYFYSAGMLWSSSDRLAPVNPRDIALVNDLKHAEPARHPHRPVGPCWEVVVPTSMQVLDEAGLRDSAGPLATPLAIPLAIEGGSPGSDSP